MHRLRVAAIAALIGLSVSGCVQAENKPSDCAAASVERHTVLSTTGLDPRNVDVCRGQELKLTVQIGADGVLHIHGYDQQAKEVRPGQTITFDFAATRAGQFVIELHTQAVPAGQGAGVLTVHEP